MKEQFGKFTTNRRYGLFAQEIFWVAEDISNTMSSLVTFYDTARGIMGTFESFVEPTEGSIMETYDAGGYVDSYPSHPGLTKISNHFDIAT